MSSHPQTILVNDSSSIESTTTHQSPVTTHSHPAPFTNSPSVFDGAFTVDVEDYFQVTAFEGQVAREDWGTYESRVVANTHRVLEILSRNSVRATFFVLGWTAERYPSLVREIHAAGHEIGSHSYWHYCIYNQTPQEFREDVRRSRDVLSDIIGQRITCYRAPTFSITAKSTWALEILVEEGFEVDSSIFPVMHDRYGMPNAQRDISRCETPAGFLWEFPPSIVRYACCNVPVSGGGYFRLYPFQLSRILLTKAMCQTGSPFMFYIHPWELDPDQPRLRLGSKLSRFRHYLNLRNTEQKLARLLTAFRLGSIYDVLRDRRSQSQDGHRDIA